MGRGIIKSTPSVTGRKKGRVSVVVTDYRSGVAVGTELSFDANPEVVVAEGDCVEFDILAPDGCKITRKVVPEGTVESNPVWEQPGWIVVTEAALHPFVENTSGKLKFSFPPPVPLPEDFPTKKGDRVEIRINGEWTCEVVKVL